MSDLDLYQAQIVRMARSPTIKVSYNRKNAANIGSLSPDLIKKLDDKQYFDDDATSKRKRKEIFLHSFMRSSPVSPKDSPVAMKEIKPNQIIERETIRNVL